MNSSFYKKYNKPSLRYLDPENTYTHYKTVHPEVRKLFQ
jgi:hypothetical protein